MTRGPCATRCRTEPPRRLRRGATRNGSGPIYASPPRAGWPGSSASAWAPDGSGRKGRITKEDVQARADGGGAAPAADAPAAGGAQPAGAGLDLLPWP